MYKRNAPFLLTVLLFAQPCLAQDSTQQADDSEAVLTATAEAIAAAEHWLAIVDSAGWLQSHTEAAQLFKSAVAPDVWVRQIRTVRTPLGPFISRHLSGNQYATSLPGAPDGEYVVLTYNAKFENKASAVETVTPMKDADGTWRVSGYYVK
jgi:hypothetical protein